MVDAGIPLWRVAVIVNTLHPDVIGRALIWQVDTGVKVTAATYDFLETDEYRSSPVVAVRDSRQPIRRHLAELGLSRRLSPGEGASCRRRYGLCGDSPGVHRRHCSRGHLVHTGTGRLHITAACRPRRGHRSVDARRRDSRVAADRDESPQHLCRPPGRRTHPHGQDPARLRRGNPRNHLALRHARLHGARRAIAAAATGRSAQQLL